MPVNDLLSKLTKLNNQNLVDVSIPSLRRTVKFRQLSVKQQKDLIKTGLDGVASGLTINNVLSQICKENSTEVIDYNVVDRVAIAVALRISAFGTKYKNNNIDIDLGSLMCKTIDLPALLYTTKQYGDELRITASLPSIARDIEINDHLVKIIKGSQDIEVGDAIGTIYMYEMVKFIDSITLGSDVVMLDTLKPQDRAQLIESLPAHILRDVVEFMQQFREIELSYLTIDGETVGIDGGFFAQ